MTAFLTAAPTTEPITLAEAKLWLRLDGAEEDAAVSALIAAARVAVELASGRKLLTQGWRIVLDAWPVDGVIRLPLSPVRSVTAMRARDAGGVAQAVTPNLWRADCNRDPALVHLVGPPPQPGQNVGGIEIDVLCGFGDAAESVPAPLRQAVRMLVARWFENRGDGAPEAALPADVAPLVAAFRRPRI